MFASTDLFYLLFFLIFFVFEWVCKKKDTTTLICKERFLWRCSSTRLTHLGVRMKPKRQGLFGRTRIAWKQKFTNQLLKASFFCSHNVFFNKKNKSGCPNVQTKKNKSGHDCKREIVFLMKTKAKFFFVCVFISVLRICRRRTSNGKDTLHRLRSANCGTLALLGTARFDTFLIFCSCCRLSIWLRTCRQAVFACRCTWVFWRSTSRLLDYRRKK